VLLEHGDSLPELGKQCGGDAAGPPGDEPLAPGISAVPLRPLQPDE